MNNRDKTSDRMGTSVAGIYSQIFSSLAANESLFPSLPETTIRLRETLDDPDCTISSAAKLLKADPGLSAFIMRIANSVRFMTLFPPKDLESALRRIGLVKTVELAITFTIKTTFTSTSGKLNSLLVDSYRQSTKVAVISYFLAGKVSKLDPSTAMLAGLLQDIGLPIIMLHLIDRPEVFENPQRRATAVDSLAPLVGELILKQWGFRKELIETVCSRKQWLRNPDADADIGDIILISRIHAAIGTPEFRNYPSIIDIPAYHKLPLGTLTPNQSLTILDEAKDELDEISQLLA